MKKFFIAQLLTASFLLFCNNAFATKCPTQQSYWGNPTVIQHPWESGKGHDAVTGKPDQTFWIKNKKKSKNAKDEAIVIVYMARQIVQHGGYFCATQLRSRNRGVTGCPHIWTQYQNPKGNFENTCFWLCEPGYSGTNCVKKDHPTANDCKYTKLTKQLIANSADYQETGDYDSATIEKKLKADCTGLLEHSIATASSNEQDVVLAAQSFLANGHGIIASPATVSAHGGFWNNSDYSDEHTKCSSGNSNITITANGGNYKTKTLCMPGFSGPGCTTTMCRECTDPLTKYNETTGQCTDCIENHVHGANGKCVQCGDNEVVQNDTCVKCKDTQYISGGQCKDAREVSKQSLYNCWPNSDLSDFAACIRDTCDPEISKTVNCITSQRALGTKTCNNGIWSECTSKKPARPEQ